MEPPKRIKVGGRNIKVKKKHIKIYGTYDDMASTIELNPKQAPDIMASSLLHEILHALWADSGLTKEFTVKNEETVVRRLESRLMALIKDNPDLIKYFQWSMR